ncbi:helix-turn-helix transcriptional regulator [Pseudomaricurvus alkylphenolicus]|uniref:helix-turn-helix transcriptional regulator n=1 Tax=Pseudomaricurvus alkylphenolicus TaxID=1306991 RepID=UPI00142138A2|nr:helix-turn-helix transcriptional regulator [Pseudomaricurvus alkylphenolicus]NIB43464.1 helix-turn-helix transcriptional regulator [Pseudomaricurvus alkylphenolicus]
MQENQEDITQSNEAFLQQVGNRVRGLRASRGMSRKMLANDSSVSERYLANLEQGKGNISISLLRKVAGALRADLGELLPSGHQQTPEQSLINEFVGRLTREEQQKALQLLHQEFSSLGGQRTRIAFVGLRGAGKSTLGHLLQERQQLPFVRLVDEIETIGGMAVSEILALSGQAGYRRLEEKALFKTLNDYESVCIETGGSIVSELKELNLLLTTCLVIWVKASPEEHMGRVVAQGDMRPMANNDDSMADLRRILEERTPYYEKAHAVLDTSGKTVEQSYTELLALVQQQTTLMNSAEASLS